MTTEEGRLPFDPAKLNERLRSSPLPEDEDLSREMAWVATYGPMTAEDALGILTDARASHVLESMWAYECPDDRLYNVANGDTTSDTNKALRAKGLRTLLTMHQRNCPACAGKLH